MEAGSYDVCIVFKALMVLERRTYGGRSGDWEEKGGYVRGSLTYGAAAVQYNHQSHGSMNVLLNSRGGALLGTIFSISTIVLVLDEKGLFLIRRFGTVTVMRRDVRRKEDRRGRGLMVD